MRILAHAVAEAVTNITKHATPYSTITLTVIESSSETSISFENLYRRQASTPRLVLYGTASFATGS